MKEIERLKKGGIAVLTTPNIHSLTYREVLFGSKKHFLPLDIYLHYICMGSPTFQEVETLGMEVIEYGYADPEGANRFALLIIHKLKPQFSWFL
ncbi:MAG: hypothetical protein OCU22_08240 [Canidatus Methanoxibalbensis ujae]|nr:hypothetical protein [Candidatus Methanoxibalbensis ujae]